MDTSSSNLTVRERAEAFECLEKSLSAEASAPRPSSEYIPGYLRSTTSATRKVNLKRGSFGGKVERDRGVKRPRLADSPVPVDRPETESRQQRARVPAPERSRESSVVSDTSESLHDETENMSPEELEEFEELKRLYAKYLQFKLLLMNMDEHMQQMNDAAERQLAAGYEAVRFQKALELANQKEQEVEEDEELNAIQSEVLDRCAQIVEIIERIDRKMAQDENLEEELEKLSKILIYMNDIKIPVSEVHDHIQALAELRESIQTIIEWGHKLTNLQIEKISSNSSSPEK